MIRYGQHQKVRANSDCAVATIPSLHAIRADTAVAGPAPATLLRTVCCSLSLERQERPADSGTYLG